MTVELQFILSSFSTIDIQQNLSSLRNCKLRFAAKLKGVPLNAATTSLCAFFMPKGELLTPILHQPGYDLVVGNFENALSNEVW
jgi:hypothetical protein